MIVLPMAGLSSRFARAGYDRPKYMLDLHGRSVFAHALGSFAAVFGSQRFLMICRDIAGTPDFVRAEARRLGLADGRAEIAVLPGETAGQAETVAAGLRLAPPAPHEPLTIFNIDTFRPGWRPPEDPAVAQADGWLEVFRGEGEHWSFVRPDPAGAGRVAEVAEKRRISDLCSDGLYHFGTTALFLDLYAGIADRDPAGLEGGERYVAPLYADALRSGLDVRYVEVPAAAVRFCGTPDEYLELKARPPFGPTEPPA